MAAALDTGLPVAVASRSLSSTRTPARRLSSQTSPRASSSKSPIYVQQEGRVGVRLHRINLTSKSITSGGVRYCCGAMLKGGVDEGLASTSTSILPGHLLPFRTTSFHRTRLCMVGPESFCGLDQVFKRCHFFEGYTVSTIHIPPLRNIELMTSTRISVSGTSATSPSTASQIGLGRSMQPHSAASTTVPVHVVPPTPLYAP